MSKSILITGGAGFIGSNFAELCTQRYPDSKIVILDKLTYAGSMKNLEGIKDKIVFYHGDIGDESLVGKILRENKITWVFNFAAESHVDNSISSPEAFVTTNVVGTFNMLWSSLKYYNEMEDEKSNFRFLHVSTDEVFGSLEVGDEEIFNEKTPYAPNSPYSATKAASDHLVRAFVKTYGLPCITTNCSNNYGPMQNVEKLIPKTIHSCIKELPITVYGNGSAIRDWIWVKEHAEGILLAMQKGKLGETYCFGGDCEKKNIDVVTQICREMDAILPRKSGKYEDLIKFVQDRQGHDMRYAVSSDKAKTELGFFHEISFSDAIKATVKWYIDLHRAS